jgi:hypothetical protein
MKHEYAGERLFLTLWVGSLWAIGYIAVPLSFATFETELAGEYAASLFVAVHVIGLLSGAMLIGAKLFSDRLSVIRSWRFWILVVMFVISVVFIVLLHPEMAAIKLVEDWRADNMLADRFDTLHLLSQNLYLLLSILGLLLVLTADKKAAANWSHGTQ